MRPTVEAGSLIGFSATASDEYDNEVPNASFAWQASPGIGGIDDSGVLHASTQIASGTVTATSEADPATSGEVGVSIVPGPAASLALSPPPSVIPAGTDILLSASAQDQYGNVISNATISWSARVGQVTALDTGGTQVLYQAPAAMGIDGITASTGAVSVSVDLFIDHGPLDALGIRPDSPTVLPGGTVRFTAVARDALGNEWTNLAVTWSVSRGVVMTDGTYTAPTTAGEAVVSVLADGTQAETGLTVIPGALSRLDVTASTLLLDPGGRAELQASAFDAYGNDIPDASYSWSASSGRLQVSPDGRSALFVAGDAATTATIVVSSGSLSASVTATVTDSPPGTDSIGPALSLLLPWVLLALASVFVGLVVRRRRSRRSPNRKDRKGRPPRRGS